MPHICDTPLPGSNALRCQWRRISQSPKQAQQDQRQYRNAYRLVPNEQVKFERRESVTLGDCPECQLAENEQVIVEELNKVQGGSVDVGGYYRPDQAKCVSVMRPSKTLNGVIDGI